MNALSTDLLNLSNRNILEMLNTGQLWNKLEITCFIRLYPRVLSREYRRQNRCWLPTMHYLLSAWFQYNFMRFRSNNFHIRGPPQPPETERQWQRKLAYDILKPSIDRYMLSRCVLIDPENISLSSQNMKLVVEWAKRTSPKLHILSSRLIIFQYQSYSHSDDMFIILKSNIKHGYITCIGFHLCIYDFLLMGSVSRLKDDKYTYNYMFLWYTPLM